MAADLGYAQEFFDPMLMQAFHYWHAPKDYVPPKNPTPLPQPEHAFVLENQCTCEHYAEYQPFQKPVSTSWAQNALNVQQLTAQWGNQDDESTNQNSQST